MKTEPSHYRISLAASKPPNIPGYTVGKVLGHGQWSSVYLAHRVSTGQVVVCKTLKHAALQHRDVVERFLREVAIACAQEHPFVLRILAAGESNEYPYLIMPFCPGGDLEQLRQRCGGRMSVVDAWAAMKPALLGLAALHERGVVHRDVKPQNILLDGAGTSLLADFGLAKSFVDAGLSGITGSSTEIMGSVPFLPREQVTHFRYVHPTADVWAAAATLYLLVTGCFPRPQHRHRSVIESVLKTSAIPLRIRDATISARISSVIDRALSDDVGTRPATMGEWIGAMDGALRAEVIYMGYFRAGNVV